jgi:cytochrome c oxidase subunit 2
MSAEMMKRIIHSSFVSGALSLTAVAAPAHSAMDPAGPQAAAIARLWWLILVTATVVFVVVLTVLAIGVIKRSKADDDQLNLESGSKRKELIVSCAGILTVTILIFFLFQSFFTGRALTAELAHKNGIMIEVTGHRWWWEARYQNVDAQNVFITANEIHIPVGVPVSFNLKSIDVIHSFWVPNLSGKKDLIPGKLSMMWLQADHPGVYRGQCAEYCGLQHAHMAFWVVAESPEDFQRWMSAQISSATQPLTESQIRGQQVFLSSACVMCHAINGTPAGSNIGPNLTHLASRQTIAAVALTNTRENLSKWIVNSQLVKPGNEMPQNNLSHADLESLLDYLQSLN